MKIAFFDSGIGGLSVLAEALRRFSGAEFLYFADEDHVPYGTKSRAEIVRLSLDAVGFLVSRGADGIVVACNTATSAAISELRGAFSVPVIGMEPAVKLAADSFGARPTLLIATPLTIAGEKLARLVGRLECETWSLALPRLVEFAQDLEFDSPAVRAYLQGELAKFELERLGSLVLGCTHFNYFKDILREILPPHVRIIDGIDGTLNRLASELGGGLKFARGEDLLSRAAKFNAGGESIKGKNKRGVEGRDNSGGGRDTESCGENDGERDTERRGESKGDTIEQGRSGFRAVSCDARKNGAAGYDERDEFSSTDECGLGMDTSRDVKSQVCADKFDADGDIKFSANSQTGELDARERDGRLAGGACGVEQCDEDKCRMSPRAVDANSQLKLYSRGGADLSLEFEPRSEGTGISRVNYPNGNSVEYFCSGRALDAAQLRKVGLFLKRLDAMRAID
ncbi:glutamate racemase [uncultured Campylobacter sp.]|uniref:glutamate racemase n=1 Tax=uncultured Campylobacter sp. TaxID=218934 RepID=UPI0028ECE480|nr:glutamate racemase [uncultured Campylobacter sp.]